MVNRHIANALHIARGVSRKGYANEGAVTEEDAVYDPMGNVVVPPQAREGSEPTAYDRAMAGASDLILNHPIEGVTWKQQADAVRRNSTDMAQGLSDLFYYPGQLLYNEKEYDPEEALQKGFGIAGAAMTGSLPIAAMRLPSAAEAASTMRIFAGPNAETADIGALRAAIEKKNAGVPEEQIWKEHGWGWNKEGKPYFEISDDKAALTEAAKNAFARGDTLEGWHLKQVLDHPELYAAYPNAMRIRTTLRPEPSHVSESGGYWEDPHKGEMHRSSMEVNAPSEELAMEVLSHEINHGVQGEADFPRGANPKNIAHNLRVETKIKMQDILDQRAQIEDALAANVVEDRPAAMAKIKELTDNHKDMSDYLWSPELTKRAYGLYRASHGESDSWVTQKRLKMTPEERRDTHPYLGPNRTSLLPRESLIVNRPVKGYADGGMPEVIDLETATPDSYASGDDTSADFFRQDKRLQQAHPEMFEQKTYKPYTDWQEEPAPAREMSVRPMSYAPNEQPAGGSALSAINAATSSGSSDAPRPVPPANIPNIPQAKNVDPRLLRILNTAGDNLPEGWSWHVTPSGGYRQGDPKFHGKGMAVDVQLVDDQGNYLPNYQSAQNFRAYEQFAQAARKAQMNLHPELSDHLRWGGYFSGPIGKYGAKDLMHFDLGGTRIPMGGGSWETGLYDRERRYLPGSKSVGIGAYARGGRTFTLDPQSEWKDNADYKKTGGKMTRMSPGEFLKKVQPLDMGSEDLEKIKKFKKKLKKGKPVDHPMAIYPAGGQDGRHHAMAAKELGIKRVPVLTWPKKADGGSIVDRATMVLSKRAKGSRGRP